tara:strand:+ start:150 stop:389 length:240 start_codon:yes stop_codon:yes gene_type:complete
MSANNNQNKFNFYTVTSPYQAIGIIEGFEELPDNIDHDQAYIQAFQFLIDADVVWTLQGIYGRTAQALIQEGTCTPKKS